MKYNNMFIIYQEVLLHFKKYFVFSPMKYNNIFIVY